MNFSREFFKEAFKAGYKKALRESRENESLEQVKIPIKIVYKKFRKNKEDECHVLAFLVKNNEYGDFASIKKLARKFNIKRLDNEDVHLFLDKIQSYVREQVSKKYPKFIEKSAEYCQLFKVADECGKIDVLIS